MISMLTIFSMYIMHVCLGSGCNSYQGHVYDSGEFWRVLGCPHVRHHWKCNIVDTFTHHFCTNGHGWTIETSFPYIRKSEWWHSPVQYITFLLILVGSTLCSTSSITTQALYKVRDYLHCCALCCTTLFHKVESCWITSTLVDGRCHWRCWLPGSQWPGFKCSQIFEAPPAGRWASQCLTNDNSETVLAHSHYTQL